MTEKKYGILLIGFFIGIFTFALLETLATKALDKIKGVPRSFRK